MNKPRRKTYWKDSDTVRYCLTVLPICLAIVIPDQVSMIVWEKHLIPPIIFASACTGAVVALGAFIARLRKITFTKEGDKNAND